MAAEYLHPVLLIIFALVYLGMALGRLPGLALDRTGIALVGAIAMVAVGGITLHDAAKSINYQTILLLFGLMLFSVQLRLAGFYMGVGKILIQQINSPRRLLLGIIFVSGFLSALLANDIVCLAFTPVLCTALLAARRNPIPYLIALATASNIGSAATIIGNPQNMYIGIAGQLQFGHFTMVMAPVVFLSLLLCWVTIVFIWREQFSSRVNENFSRAMSQPIPQPDLQISVVYKTLAILSALVVAFVLLPTGPRVVATLLAGALLLISTRKDSATLYAHVDWDLLLLFIGLFVVNGAMQQSGLTTEMMAQVRRRGIDLTHMPTLAAVATLLSNIISNVPSVLLLSPSIPRNNPQAWYILALASTLAGNLTLVGSIANLIVAEQASRLGVKLDLKSYCKVGIPLTIISVTLGTMWILLVMR
ncbi:MAG: anion transporter [Planctomycetota bacterium]|nr:anion transporter [Planctomycetota bacterium]